MIGNAIALVVFVGVIILTFLFVWGCRGLFVAGCIPMANVVILLGQQVEPPLWTLSPFLSPAVTIVMLVVLAVCWIPRLSGDSFA